VGTASAWKTQRRNKDAAPKTSGLRSDTGCLVQLQAECPQRVATRARWLTPTPILWSNVFDATLKDLLERAAPWSDAALNHWDDLRELIAPRKKGAAARETSQQAQLGPLRRAYAIIDYEGLAAARRIGTMCTQFEGRASCLGREPPATGGLQSQLKT
jgi:hypothetical protein